jgi:hypothetical protein
MPAHRDPNSGEVVDTPTVKSSGDTPTATADTTKNVQRTARHDAGGSAYDAKTVKVGSGSKASESQSQDADPKTRILRSSRKSAPATGADTAGAEAEASAAMDDPPAGWLVIVEGPGQGNFVTIGYGSNSIGRDPSERVSLDFGDERISRTQHAVLTYDPRGRKFFVQHGGGKNLTYLNNEPVLTPVMLEPNVHIQIADTVLRFVPLCSDDFDWQEQDVD